MADHKSTGNGLFARVLKFVRSPSAGWSEFDVPEDARESGYSKQMLKEMIERKRRNDFVRRREFDMLRKLRRSEAIAGHDPAARPSFFQSSLPSRPDDRASTLKKIDEIEAQMSQQWWKTKSADISSTGGGLVTSTGPAAPVSSYSGPGGLATTRGAGLVSETLPAHALPHALSEELSFELPLLQPQAPAPVMPPPPPPPRDTAPAWLGTDFGLAEQAEVSGFTLSKAFAMDVEELADDAELEDVAIRFAHGDDAGTEVALRALVGAGGARQDHEETWLALFDLYRAIGQPGRFDDAAVEFANRFGRSAPQWTTARDPASRVLTTVVAAPPVGHPADWICPAVLTVQTVQTLQLALARSAPPWRLSWARLTRIDEAALEPLSRLFAQWAGQPVRLHFIAAQQLDELLRQPTVSGDPNVSPAWWKLRMEALRVMHRADEFEMVALDYCVTYEVSPPSWDSPRCQYKALAADGGDGDLPSVPSEGFRDSAPNSMPASAFGDGPVSRLTPQLQAELSGHLRGDISAVLDKFPAVMAGELLLVSCASLTRVDFAAAGSLLNWCTARQSEGCLLHLTDVHRLVAAFFKVVGISGAARISLRRD